jgi:hypothetical protein
MGTKKKNVMLIPVGVSKGGHIKKIVMLVPVEDGHIKKN